MTGLLQNLRDWTGQAEEMATDALAALGPWLAPIPSAALVTKASVAHLGWSDGLGLVAGAIIEILGLTATSTALTLWSYNEGRRKSDPSAPFGLAVVLVGFYYVSTVGLTVLLDIAPDLARYAPVIFPTLALVGTVNLALRAQHKRRVETIQADKARRRESRKTKTSEKVRYVPGGTAERSTSPKYTTDGTIEKARAILAESPDVSGSELGRRLGRSERLGRKLKAELVPVISGNGRGT